MSCSGLISDHSTIEEAVTSIKRNGVGLKGMSMSNTLGIILLPALDIVIGVLRTKLDEVDQHSLNVYLRLEYEVWVI